MKWSSSHTWKSVVEITGSHVVYEWFVLDDASAEDFIEKKKVLILGIFSAVDIINKFETALKK